MQNNRWLASEAACALRALMKISRNPLEKCEALSQEIYLAFSAAIPKDGEEHSLLELETAIIEAHNQVWIEFGGKPNAIPAIKRVFKK